MSTTIVVGATGITKPGKMEQTIDLTKWSQQSEVKEVWKKLAKREGLDEKALKEATWGFLGFVQGRNYDLVISMSKARKLGWTGIRYEGSWEGLSKVFDTLKDAKVLP
ncbi:hypothetical protein LZL87_013105 [Fusarium oxysporum]|nr:hypothetical protein LZL87_013105 [Fusarium oxysporum]